VTATSSNALTNEPSSGTKPACKSGTQRRTDGKSTLSYTDQFKTSDVEPKIKQNIPIWGSLDETNGNIFQAMIECMGSLVINGHVVSLGEPIRADRKLDTDQSASSKWRSRQKEIPYPEGDLAHEVGDFMLHDQPNKMPRVADHPTLLDKPSPPVSEHFKLSFEVAPYLELAKALHEGSGAYSFAERRHGPYPNLRIGVVEPVSFRYRAIPVFHESESTGIKKHKMDSELWHWSKVGANQR